MLRITEAEKRYLTTHGVGYGENGISHTYSHNQHYYICETPKNKELLKKYYAEVGLNPKDVDKRCSAKRR